MPRLPQQWAVATNLKVRKLTLPHFLLRTLGKLSKMFVFPKNRRCLVENLAQCELSRLYQVLNHRQIHYFTTTAVQNTLVTTEKRLPSSLLDTCLKTMAALVVNPTKPFAWRNMHPFSHRRQDTPGRVGKIATRVTGTSSRR